MRNEDLGQVFTRRVIADYMVSFFSLPSKSIVLDPCFGDGVFLSSLSTKTDYIQVGYEIDIDLFNSYGNKTSNAILYNSDFLLHDAGMNFDGIIMNPPYIRHEKIDNLERYGVTKDNLSKQPVFASLPKSANLYMYFVVKAINLLKPNGELVVIFPDSWLNSRSGAAFREVLSDSCSIEKRVHVTGKAFEKDALVDVVILKLRKNSTLLDCEPLYVSIEGDTINDRKIERFSATVDDKVSFPKYASIKRGLTTGFNEAFINPVINGLSDDYFEDIISSPKAVSGYSTMNAVFDKLLIIDRENDLSEPISIYLKKLEARIIKSKKPKTLAEKIQNGGKWYSLRVLDCKGILFGYIIRNDMRFILNGTGKIARDNFYVITPKINEYILLALLNNHYVSIQLEATGRKYGGGMLKLQKYDVESIMLPNLSDFSVKDIKAITILGQKLAETSNREIIDEITMLLSKYESADYETAKSQLDYMRSVRLEGAK